MSIKPIINYFNNDPKEEKILIRKKELYSTLSDEKIQYIKNGICDSYILYGKPTLENVIDTMKVKNSTKMKRMSLLLKKLQEIEEEYDENVSYYKKYISSGGNIDYCISEGIKEWFYLNKTNYLELRKKYKNDEYAKIKALNDYIKKYGTNKYTEMIRNEDMVIRLY